MICEPVEGLRWREMSRARTRCSIRLPCRYSSVQKQSRLSSVHVLFPECGVKGFVARSLRRCYGRSGDDDAINGSKWTRTAVGLGERDSRRKDEALVLSVENWKPIKDARTARWPGAMAQLLEMRVEPVLCAAGAVACKSLWLLLYVRRLDVPV